MIKIVQSSNIGPKGPFLMKSKEINLRRILKLYFSQKGYNHGFFNSVYGKRISYS